MILKSFLCLCCALIAKFIPAVLGYWVGAGIPFIAICVYASEIFGGTSVDRGQTFLVIVLHTFLYFTLLILFIVTVRNPVGRMIQETVDHGKPLCYVKTVTMGILGGNRSSITVNQTKASYYTREELEAPCWGVGLAIGWAGAVPEEIMKFFTLAVFMKRGWIADQFGVLVYSFVIGCTFGFVENNSYVPAALKATDLASAVYVTISRTFLMQTLLHPAYSVISGMLLAQRKFLFWRSHGPISCCEITGPRPTMLMVLPAIYFHFMNNLIVGAKPGFGIFVDILNILYWINTVITVSFAVYLVLTLKHVPKINIYDLGTSGILPNACSYICCCCCGDTQRDRRYESVINMTDMTANNEEEEAYVPPTIVEA